MIFLWIAFIIFSSLQIISLPHSIVEFLSPNSAHLYDISKSDSFYLSVDIGQSKISFIKLLSLFCLMTLIFQLVNSEERLRLVLLTIVASGTFQAIYGALELLLNVENSLMFNISVSTKATGSFIYHNHYANFLLLCLSAGVGLMVTALEKEKSSSPRDFIRTFVTSMLSSKAIIRICLIIMVIALVMSKSRMGNVAFFTSMTITSLIALLLIKNRSSGLLILVISMFIIDLLIVSAYFGLERVKTRLAQTSLENETRDEVVLDALKIIPDFPLFGSGAGSFYSIYPGYQSTNFSAFYDHAHNDYLQFVVEFGFLGFLMLVALVAFSLYKSLRAIYRRKNSIFKGVGVACTMGILGMLIHISADFPLQSYANSAYFVIFISLSMVINSLKLRKFRKTNK